MSRSFHGQPIGLEMGVKDTARASAFYNAVFQWQFRPPTALALPPEKFMVFSVPNSNFEGAIIKFNELSTGPGTLKAYLRVDNVDDAISDVEKHGGKRVGEKKHEGDKAEYHYFEDTEGNTNVVYALKK